MAKYKIWFRNPYGDNRLQHETIEAKDERDVRSVYDGKTIVTIENLDERKPITATKIHAKSDPRPFKIESVLRSNYPATGTATWNTYEPTYEPKGQ